MIDVTVLGNVKRRQALTRAGARPGDGVYVSGTLGAAAVGLRMLKSATTEMSSAVEICTRRYLYPDPRVRLGLLLSRNRAASAAVDLSDGLADGVRRIAEGSGVGVIIEADALPIDVRTRSWFEERGLDPVTETLLAGDDYELLLTVPPRTRRRLAAARRCDVPLTRIGECTKGRAVLLRVKTNGTDAEREMPPGGYDHFR
jgi:thiamine-monophosphate kinase